LPNQCYHRKHEFAHTDHIEQEKIREVRETWVSEAIKDKVDDDAVNFATLKGNPNEFHVCLKILPEALFTRSRSC
jgi:hypothetical protein